MPIKRYKPEQIVTMLRQIEVSIANGKTTPQACKEAEITIQTFYRWRKEYGGRPGPGTATVMKDLPLSKVYQLLEPGPVVLLTTASKGRAKVMAMSWHMMVELEPPLLPVSSAARSQLCRIAGDERVECVIAVPALELAPKVVEVGNCSGRDVEKFERFGLSPAPAERVAPPVVAEGFALGPSWWRP
jgi:hypothetical protein